MIVRPGGLSTALAMLMVTGVAAITYVTATTGTGLIRQLMIVAVVIHGVMLFFGSMRWIGLSTVPMIVAIMAEAGMSDEPFWIRATVIGCLWYATMEVSWHAINLRFGGHVSTAALSRRLQDSIGVIVGALVIGLVAATGVTAVPERTAVLEALVLGVVLAGAVFLIRGVRAGADDARDSNRV